VVEFLGRQPTADDLNTMADCGTFMSSEDELRYDLFGKFKFAPRPEVRLGDATGKQLQRAFSVDAGQLQLNIYNIMGVDVVGSNTDRPHNPGVEIGAAC